MKQLLITDLHLGIKNGSITWLKSQQQFLEHILNNYIIKNTPDRVICLGDVFDTRVGVQTHVATFARDWFTRISEWCPVVIIAGNHDYYSPDTDKYCALDNILAGIKGVEIVSHEIVFDEGLHQVYIPWFMQEKYGVTELSKKFAGNILFTHADIGMSKCKLHAPTFSGHIHFPTINPKQNRYSLGSCFPLTFADCDERCAYLLESDGKANVIRLDSIPNNISIQFHRYYEWPEDLDLLPETDYIELYLKRDEIRNEQQLDEWKKKFPNITIYQIANEINADENIDMSKDMEQIITGLIPEEYKNEFDEIRNQP